MSRYQPPRSPPRFSERRPSVNYNGPPGPRNSDAPNQAVLDRAPPRGPKAHVHYDAPSRGRGSFRGPFGGRADYRERDARPPMNGDRRDEGRSDWPRRDRDFNSGERGGFSSRGGRGYIGRDRSASPLRTRRGSSEAISVHNSRIDGTSNFYGNPSRGSYAGRGGRGDWDRSRGRGSFVSERDRPDLLPPRSRSREDFVSRDRDRGRDLDLERKAAERWEPDASRDRDLKSREHDLWQRDRSIGRQSSGSGPTSAAPQMQNRGDQNPSATTFDPARRRSSAFTPGPAARDRRRDGDVPEYFVRAEQPRDTLLSRKLSPTPAPTSAAVGALDYGPPPISKSAETPADLLPLQRDPTPKIEPLLIPASSSSFLPPTGPKAERPVGPSAQAIPLKSSTSEQWTKPEIQPRALRPAPTVPAVTKAPDQIKIHDQSRDVMDLDRQAQGIVPSGPRGSLMTNKPRMLSQQLIGSPAPPTGPTLTTKTSPVEFRASIPTGPRSERDELKVRPGPPWPTGNATWTSPDYKPRPSIMNNLQSKPPFDGREIHRTPPSAFIQKPRFQPPIVPRPKSTADLVKRGKESTQVVVIDDNGRIVKPEEETDSAVDVDISLNPSSDDEADDDGFDEEDFADSEEKFQKQMRQLEAKKPPPPLEDPIIVELLLGIQFLGLIIEGVPLQAIELSIDLPISDNEPVPRDLSSPEQLPEEQIDTPPPRRVLGRPLSKHPVNPIQTPPFHDLPYLKKSTPQFEIFEDSDNEVQHEAVITAMRTEFEKAAWQQNEDLEEIRSFYNDHYPAWKRKVADLDRLKLDAKQPSPRPTTPVPPMPVIIAQPPTTERPSRASMRNATEYDLEKVMEESKMMEQERKEAREREAAELEASGARPDYNQEAVVPNMINTLERDLSAYRDENWKVSPALALDIFEYIPPVDDFTDEEQELFIKAFVNQPKKWGKIADALPMRDYKQCIMHYYLTKNEAAYKERVRLSQPRRRRGRVAKPRNTALGDLALSYDGGPTAVTDSGRPRRAAAPTFGEAGTDSEAVTPAPTGVRRGARATDFNAQAGEKPARAKKTGTGAPKPRRTKKVAAETQQQAVQMLQDIPGTVMSPQKVQPATPRAIIHKIKELPVMVEPTQIMEIQTSIEQDTVHFPAFKDTERSNGLTGPPGSSPSPQITSYWSVPEQQKFPDLIAYFGRDYQAIADFMKTKSPTMIKNFYTREFNTGKKELEDAAKRAEGMRERGEPMGPPPTPVAPPKRRYEATPSTASTGRPVLSLDLAAPAPMHGVPITGSAMIDEFPVNTIQRGAWGELVAKPRTSCEVLGPGLQPSNLQQRGDEGLQSMRTQLLEPRQSSGPRPGFFQHERQELRPASQGMRTSLQEQAPKLQQHGVQHILVEQQQQRRPLFQQQNLQSSPDVQNRSQPQSQPHPEPERRPPYQIEAVAQQQPREILAHARRDSAGTAISASREKWDRESDTASFRREPPHRGLQYTHAPAQLSQSGFPTMADALREVPRPASTPLAAQAEPHKQAPAKRSNIFSLLDDRPPEPAPPKRPSLEGPYSQSTQSPSLSALAHENSRQRQPPRSTTPLALQVPRPQYLPIASSRPAQPTAEHNPPFSGSPVTNASRDWLSRFDPRHQSGATEPTPVQVQPPVAQYGTSNPQPSSLSRLQIDMPGRQEPSHRSTLSQLQHPGHNPSPPPQMSIRGGIVGPPFRSASGPSQQQHHSRVTSLGYPQSQTQQPAVQPGSAGSTPVSALHPSRVSLNGYEDQRFLQQREQHVREQQLREQQLRDHQMREQQIREQQAREQQAREQEVRQRDYDLQQQQQHTYMQVRQQRRAQEMEQDRYRYPGGAPRTFTPPNAGQFSTAQQQQQVQGQHPAHYRQYSQGGAGPEERR